MSLSGKGGFTPSNVSVSNNITYQVSNSRPTVNYLHSHPNKTDLAKSLAPCVLTPLNKSGQSMTNQCFDIITKTYVDRHNLH